MMERIVNIIKEEPFIGEDGLDYIKVTKEILTPRKTFLKGTISGKYRGNKIPDDFDKADLFDFEIYEAEVLCNSKDDFSKNRPFVFPNDFKNLDNQKKIKGKVFPKHKLPEILPVIISANSRTFGINVLEPQLYEFEINRKYHQTEGEEIFGCFNAYVTGYVFDYEKEETEEIIGPIVEEVIEIEPPMECIPSTIETGRFETKPNYIRKEVKCFNHNDTVWSNWEYTGRKIGASTPNGLGCLSDIIGILGAILFLVFLVAVLPAIGYFAVFYIAILIISLIAPYLKWVFRIIGTILMIAFIGSLINAFTHNSHNYSPKPLIDNQKETSETNVPIDNTGNANNQKKNTENDYLIKKYREWKDYDGNSYKGYYTLKKSDIEKAVYYKTNLQIMP